MSLSSPNISFDSRLLAVEELFRQRKLSAGQQELLELSESEFRTHAHERGLFLSLRANAAFYEGNYKAALDDGLQAARILADFPLNRRYGRSLLILAKSYAAVGDLKNAEIRGRDALATYRRADDPIGQVDSLNELARVAYIRFDFATALSCLQDAMELVGDNPRKKAQLTGNMGRIAIRTGHWAHAEEQLTTTLAYNREHNEEISEAINLLDFGLLQIRQRRFSRALRSLDSALEIISRLGLKREKIIYQEFAGELALERGDLFRAKSVLSNAYHDGLMLAPGSALVSQSARRLADVELALDNLDAAMKYGQKALELSLSLGEKKETGLSYRVVAQVRAAHEEFDEALDAIGQAEEILRQVGDPFMLARTLLIKAEILMAANSKDQQKIRGTFEEAHRLFKQLGVTYWMAQSNFREGVFCCQEGDFSRGFRRLASAEKHFTKLNEASKVRAVGKFLRSLSDQALALSISQENEYKVFGNILTPDERTELNSNRLEDILQILLARTGGSRALICSDEPDLRVEVSTVDLNDAAARRFSDGFRQLVGQEVSRKGPSLILDCRRDPYVNALFENNEGAISSVIVLPFRMSDDTRYFLYIDRMTADSGLNPFSQVELNFAVGFSDLVAFKWTEIQKNRLLEDNVRLKRELMDKSSFPSIISNSDAVLSLLDQVKQVVDSNISISIEGETGTGKDLLARAIHYNSIRKDKRFISVNCAALPESLLESELFGFKRGAFTGADRDKSGLFEEANGGTFFLDEIADMPLKIQAKILRVLEDKEIVRLGDTVPRKVDVRIVSATNKDLRIEMNRGSFRHDLYYRLSALTFRIPALRERRDDIPLLIAHFLDGTGRTITDAAMKYLVQFDWPGNVRELENEIKKMVLLSGEIRSIDVDRLSERIRGVTLPEVSPDSSPDATADVSFSESYSLYDHLSRFERQFIVRALKEKNGVKKHAASLLNIPESTLRLKIKQYDIDADRFSASA